MSRVDDIDLLLTATTEAFKDAVERLDGDAADVLYAELNDLLDERLHVPAQRQGQAY